MLLAESGALVIVRILEAKLFRSFDAFGRMDPFAVADWTPCDGMSAEIGRTKSHWGGHMSPVWRHTCKQFPYSDGGVLRIRVLEENYGGYGTPTFCGEVSTQIESVIKSAETVSEGLLSSQVQQLTLIKKEEETGTVSIQVMLKTCFYGLTERKHTPVCLDNFETPVMPTKVSGGTAPFFCLRLRNPGKFQSAEHWIGKDLSRAADELAFYEKQLELRNGTGGGLEHMIEFMFEYAGILECPIAEDDGVRKQLLVIRNLRDGHEHLRMLDLKVGEKTGVAGWQGKSRMSAIKQGLVDGLTNSVVEGFRLEGFDGQPPALASLSPLLEFGGTESMGKDIGKKARRIMLQRMEASTIFMHFLDTHQVPADVEGDGLDTLLSPAELTELVHSEIVNELVRLALACRRTPVPQKWIGSSVALGFDDAKLPKRAAPEEEVRRKVVVKVFDWGRSELNTLDQHATLSADDQEDRREYWRYYCGGIDNMAWQAARAYKHRFGNCNAWDEVEITIYPFDTLGMNDFFGRAAIPLQNTSCTPEATVELLDRDGVPVKVGQTKATLTYALSWRRLPEDSRLSGSWQLYIKCAQNLPGGVFSGPLGAANAFVSVVARADGGRISFEQQSTVVQSNTNPAWDEKFEVPIARKDLIRDALDGLGMGEGDELTQLLPALKGGEEKEAHEALESWKNKLTAFCAQDSALPLLTVKRG
mmetsp:Transcript_17868/g.34829  ORF Transcript_17868/g.34829 Transcript_17868/m.34829 type:complete len:702 (-) Transcript_17868:94-2199(-)